MGIVSTRAVSSEMRNVVVEGKVGRRRTRLTHGHRYGQDTVGTKLCLETSREEECVDDLPPLCDRSIKLFHHETVDTLLSLMR